MRRGKKKDVREVEGRIYLDNQHPDICPVRTFMEFKRRKTEFQNSERKPLLWTVKQSAQANPERELFWYTNCRMGINLIGSLFQNAFSQIGVDIKAEKIKATSCRKNLVQAGADSNVPGHFISKMTGQKNLDSKLEYLTNKEKTHKAASLVVNRKTAGVSGANFAKVLNEISKETKDKDHQSENNNEQSGEPSSSLLQKEQVNMFH